MVSRTVLAFIMEGNFGLEPIVLDDLTRLRPYRVRSHGPPMQNTCVASVPFFFFLSGS